MSDNSYKFRIFLGFLIFFFSFNAGTVPVSLSERSSFLVTSGSPSLPPVKTDFGYIFAEDNRFLCACSKSGQNLWLVHTGKINSFSVNDSGFTFVITQGGDLILINPSGKVLWRKYTQFVPKNVPVCTSEGRVYVSSEDTVSAFGLGSIYKWSVTTPPQTDVPPVLMNDQSLLIFIQNENQSVTQAERFSMYGKKIEEITFNGKLIKSFSTSDQIFLLFDDGTIKAINVKNNANIISKIDVLWENSKIKSDFNTKILKINSEKTAFIIPSKKILIIENNSGKILNKINISEIKNDIFYADLFNDCFFLMDDSICALYSQDGNLLNCFDITKIRKKYPYKYALLHNDGKLHLFSEDWTINIFNLFSQNNEKKDSEKNQFNYIIPYKDNISFNYTKNPVIQDFSKISVNLQNSGYAEQEIEITKYCLSVIDNELNKNTTVERNFSYSDQIINEFSPSYYDSLFKLCTVMQNSTLQEKFIEIFNNETDSLILSKALEAASFYPYDPDLKMLKSLEKLIRNTNPKEKLILINAAFLVYEISQFMGKPSFCAYGKHILSDLFRPQYDVKLKEFVRSLYQKLADTK